MRLRLAVVLVLALSLLGHAPPAFAGCTIAKIAELPITMRGLRPTITAKVNGVEGVFFIDTGAFFSFLSSAGTKKFQVPTRLPESGLGVYGVRGRDKVTVGTAHVFSLAGLDFHHVDFLVDQSDFGFGDGIDGLIGGNLLAHADVEYDLGNGVIRLFQTTGDCQNTPLAYWAAGGPYSVINIERMSSTANHIQGDATLNGARVIVIFDSGAPLSTLTLLGAQRAGVTSKTAGVIDAEPADSTPSWVAPFASFKVGDEEIKNARLRFSDIHLGGADMLVGADFFLSHRIFVSSTQHKLYFTYSGGPVFKIADGHPTAQTSSSTTPPAAAPSVTAATSASPYSNEPKDAAGFGRRGAAYTARLEYSAAIADLTKAIALDPTSEEYVLQRAEARIGDRQTAPAMADLDAALKLKPDDMTALMLRGTQKAAAKDLEGAKLDLAAAAKLMEKQPQRRWELIDADETAEFWDAMIGQLDAWISENAKGAKLAQGLNARCWARARQGRDLDKALDDCNAALHKIPGEGAFLDSRALVHLKRGEFDQGIGDYQEILRWQPKNAWALYGRGWALIKKGQKAAGDADIKAAAVIEPKVLEQAKTRGLSL